MNHDLPSLWKSETVWAWNHWITSLVARSGSEMTCYWIAASEQWTIPNAEYSFFDIHSLEWSNLHLSNWFRWKDYASMRLHCFHSLVAERTRQLSLSTRPAFHSFDTLITPTHQPVKGSEVFAILHGREYFVLIEAFRMYWNERSIPVSRHYPRSLSFLSPNHTSIHLVSTLRLTHSSILLSHPQSHSITPFNPLHLCPILTHNRIPSLVLVQPTLTKHRSIQYNIA